MLERLGRNLVKYWIVLLKRSKFFILVGRGILRIVRIFLGWIFRLDLVAWWLIKGIFFKYSWSFFIASLILRAEYRWRNVIRFLLWLRKVFSRVFLKSVTTKSFVIILVSLRFLISSCIRRWKILGAEFILKGILY